MKADILIAKTSIVEGGNQRRLDKVKTLQLPEEFLKYLSQPITDGEVIIQFNFGGINYTHTLRLHEEDKAEQRRKNNLLELLLKREDLTAQINKSNK